MAHEKLQSIRQRTGSAYLPYLFIYSGRDAEIYQIRILYNYYRL